MRFNLTSLTRILTMNGTEVRMSIHDDPRAEIIAQHADYVSGHGRFCSCGTWSDQSYEAQHTRIPFAHHVLSRLAMHGYVVTND